MTYLLLFSTTTAAYRGAYLRRTARVRLDGTSGQGTFVESLFEDLTKTARSTAAPTAAVLTSGRAPSTA